MSLASDIVIVSIACGSQSEADAISRHLVEQRLAACVQSHPITSTYHWQGEIETANEIMLTAKTLTFKLEALETMVRQHHSYEVPEILATPATWVSESYAQWLRESLQS